MDQAFGHGEVVHDVETANVVYLAESSFFQNRLNSTAMIDDVKPITLLHTVAVDGERFVIDGVGN